MNKNYSPNTDSDTLIPANKIEKFLSAVFSKLGLDDFSRSAVVDGLMFASIRGIDSHGIRLAPHYANCAQTGVKNPRPKFSIHKTKQSIIWLDADGAYGLAAGRKAVELGIEIAKESGIAFVGVRNSTHPAAMSSIVAQAAAKGFIGFGFANADALMCSHGGKKAFYGTNPISFCTPMGETMFTLDMATTQFTWNKIKIYREKNISLPNGIAVDCNGNETTDPHNAAALLPTGLHKGFALAAMVEILTGVISGSLISPEITPMYADNLNSPRQLSQSYIFIDQAVGGGAKLFQKRILKMAELLIDNDSTEKDVILPGLLESKVSEKRLAEGIPIDAQTMKKFRQLEELLGLSI